uniref:THAP domain-containing protein 2-like n=1 Tax=Paramormyrops kingsleyae TaxID=1676925 RepID=A0A3B3SP61_9TELE
MVKSCCATDCTNRYSKKSELSFYRLPKNKERRIKWITAMRRNNWNPGSETWICGFHFVSGKKSDDPLHPDYVPSIFSFTSTADQNLAVNNLEKYLRSQEVCKKRHVRARAVEVQDTEVQTEETHNDISSLHEQIKSLNTECQSLREKVHKLESELNTTALVLITMIVKRCFTKTDAVINT